MNCTILFGVVGSVNNTTNALGCVKNAPVENLTPTTGQENNEWIPMLLLGLLIIIINSFICIAFACNRGIRTRAANILVFSQAGVDLLNALLFIPFNAAEKYQGRQSVTPYVICYVLFVSLFNLFALAIDRSLALIKPLYHHMHIGRGQMLRWLSVIWIIPLLLSMIPLTWQFEPAHTKDLAIRIYLASLWLFMLCLCILMACMYLKIYTVARKMIRQRHETLSSNNAHTHQRGSITKKELRIAHLFALLLLFFFLAYLPILYINFAALINQHHLIPQKLVDVSLYSLISNSVVNPLLCIWFKKDYQTAIANLFRLRTSKPRPVLGESLRSTISRTDENLLFSPRSSMNEKHNGTGKKDGKNLPTLFEGESSETKFTYDRAPEVNSNVRLLEDHAPSPLKDVTSAYEKEQDV